MTGPHLSRRGILMLLSASGLAPALPQLGATTGFRLGLRSRALFLAKVRAQLTVADLVRVLKICPETAQDLLSDMVRRGAIAAPITSVPAAAVPEQRHSVFCGPSSRVFELSPRIRALAERLLRGPWASSLATDP